MTLVINIPKTPSLSSLPSSQSINNAKTMCLEYDGAHDGKNPLSPNGEPVMTIRTFLTELQQRGVTV